MREISEDISGLSRLLEKHSERLDEIKICGNHFSDASTTDPIGAQISKALSRSAVSIKEYSKELYSLKNALADIAQNYDEAERKIGSLFSYSFLAGAAGPMDEKHEKSQNYRKNLANGNFSNAKAGHISSNELILPDWLMDAVIKSDIFLKET